MLAAPTLLPGSESGGFGQDDVASPVFAGWSKQERAGELLELTLATLAPVAMRAFKVAGRPPPPPPLDSLARQTMQCFPDGEGRTALGPQCAALAELFRKRIYS